MCWNDPPENLSPMQIKVFSSSRKDRTNIQSDTKNTVRMIRKFMNRFAEKDITIEKVTHQIIILSKMRWFLCLIEKDLRLSSKITKIKK